MRALKLIQLMKANAADISEDLLQKIRASGKCRDFLLRVPESEQRQYACEIYGDLIEWMAKEANSVLEQRYIALGARRAGQGVPLSQIFWAVSIAREHLWEYTQHECLLEEPVEFWGGLTLLHSLNTFFDHVLYFALAGYDKASHDESAALAFLSSRRSA
jgi:hypothetical protein